MELPLEGYNIKKTRYKNINWNVFERVDIDKIRKENDVDSIESFFKQIQIGRIKEDEYLKVIPENLKSFLKITQMTLQYLNYTQLYQSDLLTTIQNEDDNISEKAQIKNDIIIELEVSLKKSKKDLKQRNQKVKIERDTIQKFIKQVTSKGIYSCYFCNSKHFTSVEMLMEHYKRRHEDELPKNKDQQSEHLLAVQTILLQQQINTMVSAQQQQNLQINAMYQNIGKPEEDLDEETDEENDSMDDELSTPEELQVENQNDSQNVKQEKSDFAFVKYPFNEIKSQSVGVQIIKHQQATYQTTIPVQQLPNSQINQMQNKNIRQTEENQDEELDDENDIQVGVSSIPIDQNKKKINDAKNLNEEKSVFVRINEISSQNTGPQTIKLQNESQQTINPAQKQQNQNSAKYWLEPTKNTTQQELQQSQEVDQVSTPEVQKSNIEHTEEDLDEELDEENDSIAGQTLTPADSYIQSQSEAQHLNEEKSFFACIKHAQNEINSQKVGPQTIKYLREKFDTDYENSFMEINKFQNQNLNKKTIKELEVILQKLDINALNIQKIQKLDRLETPKISPQVKQLTQQTYSIAQEIKETEAQRKIGQGNLQNNIHIETLPINNKQTIFSKQQDISQVNQLPSTQIQSTVNAQQLARKLKKEISFDDSSNSGNDQMGQQKKPNDQQDQKNIKFINPSVISNTTEVKLDQKKQVIPSQQLPKKEIKNFQFKFEDSLEDLQSDDRGKVNDDDDF